MKIKEWDGEGVPPIGTVCEYHWAADEWRRCEVVGHYLGSVVAVDVFDSSALRLPVDILRPFGSDGGKSESTDLECRWGDDDDEGIWNAECGELFQFYADGPIENGFKFCPYCGKELCEVEK